MSGDVNFSNVSLLLHFEAAAPYVDSSSYAQTVTTDGGAPQDAVIFKFGAASLKPTFRAAAIHVDDAAENDLSTGDFTIEGWCYYGSSGFPGDIVNKSDSGGNKWPYRIFMDNSGNFGAIGYDNAAAVVFNLAGGTITGSTWQHVALVRHGNRFDFYLDGVSQANSSSASALNVTTDPLYIGGDPGPSHAWPGQLDDIRITKGVARYTGNFTPPTASFPDGGFVGPSISVQPQDQSVAEPDTATFSVTASSSGGTLLYQWYKNTVLIGGATSSSYTTPANTNAGNDGDVFKVTVTDDNDTVTSDNATLSVSLPTTSYLAAFTDPNKPFIPLELWLVMHYIRTRPGYNKAQYRADAHAAAAAGDTWVKRDPQTKQYYARRPKYN